MGMTNRVAWRTTFTLLCLSGIPASGGDEADPAGGKKGLLIVAPRSFLGELKRYVAFKSQYRSTDLVALEDAIREGHGADDPERLKGFLYERWKAGKVGYVLLAGDVSVLPTRYVAYTGGEKCDHIAFMPTDSYYADLALGDGRFSDWNSRKDGPHARLVGEMSGRPDEPMNVDGIDHHPDVALGRWPVRYVKEVGHLVAKSIEYEAEVRAGKKPGLRRAGFFNTGYRDARGLFDDLARRLGPGWEVEPFYYGDDARPRTTPPPDAANLVRLLNSGAGLVAHVGHGSPEVWVDSFGPADFARLRNAGRLPIVISIGCDTAKFAPYAPYDAFLDERGHEHPRGWDLARGPSPMPSPYQKGVFNRECLGKRMLRDGPGGAVAYIGCNVTSQSYGMTLLDAFIGAIASGREATLGGCWDASLEHYGREKALDRAGPGSGWGPLAEFQGGMRYTLFGDPSLPVPPPK
jgi:hypothetical protein